MYLILRVKLFLLFCVLSLSILSSENSNDSESTNQAESSATESVTTKEEDSTSTDDNSSDDTSTSTDDSYVDNSSCDVDTIPEIAEVIQIKTLSTFEDQIFDELLQTKGLMQKVEVKEKTDSETLKTTSNYKQTPFDEHYKISRTVDKDNVGKVYISQETISRALRTAASRNTHLKLQKVFNNAAHGAIYTNFQKNNLEFKGQTHSLMSQTYKFDVKNHPRLNITKLISDKRFQIVRRLIKEGHLHPTIIPNLNPLTNARFCHSMSPDMAATVITKTSTFLLQEGWPIIESCMKAAGLGIAYWLGTKSHFEQNETKKLEYEPTESSHTHKNPFSDIAPGQSITISENPVITSQAVPSSKYQDRYYTREEIAELRKQEVYDNIQTLDKNGKRYQDTLRYDKNSYPKWEPNKESVGPQPSRNANPQNKDEKKKAVGTAGGGAPMPPDPNDPWGNKNKHQKIELFEKNSKHIFRVDDGHLSDTIENRKLLIETASDPKNYLGTDNHGNLWFAKTLPDGRQIWASLRGNSIRNGGLNDSPKIFDPTTGLCKPRNKQ